MASSSMNNRSHAPQPGASFWLGSRLTVRWLVWFLELREAALSSSATELRNLSLSSPVLCVRDSGCLCIRRCSGKSSPGFQLLPFSSLWAPEPVSPAGTTLTWRRSCRSLPRARVCPEVCRPLWGSLDKRSFKKTSFALTSVHRMSIH